jgi:DNA-binding transcriptional MerR regulator
MKKRAFANPPAPPANRDDIKLIQKISLLEEDGVNLVGIKIILEMQNQQVANPRQSQSANLKTQLIV